MIEKKDVLNNILHFDRQIETTFRISSGAFYTPLSIAERMVDDALSGFLGACSFSSETVTLFLKMQLPKADAQALLRVLLDVKWIDMAAGTGVFGYAYLNKLSMLIKNYQSELYDDYMRRVMLHMVLNDINKRALAQFKDLVQISFGLEFVGTCIHVNALTALLQVPIIEQILSNGGFDIVIGNPPYLGERGNKVLFGTLKRHAELAEYYEAKMDLFYFFIYRGYVLLSEKGVLTQITTSYFTTADGAAKLRLFLREKADFLKLRYYTKIKAFSDVKSLSFTIFSLVKKREKLLKCQLYYNGKMRYLEQDKLYDVHGQIMLLTGDMPSSVVRFTKSCSLTIGDVFNVNQGIVSGADKVTKHHINQYDSRYVLKSPIFVFEDEVFLDIPLTERRFLKPFIKNSDIARYQLKNPATKWVLYSAFDNLKNNRYWLEHLKRYKLLLQSRREVKTGVRAWYELQWPRKQQIFDHPKIVVPQRALKNVFAYVETPVYASADVYFLSIKEGAYTSASKAFFNLSPANFYKAITIYLNSSIVYQWLKHYGKKKGAMLELYATPLKRIPLPAFDDAIFLAMAELYDDFFKNQNQAVLDQIENYIEATVDKL